MGGGRGVSGAGPSAGRTVFLLACTSEGATGVGGSSVFKHRAVLRAGTVGAAHVCGALVSALKGVLAQAFPTELSGCA